MNLLRTGEFFFCFGLPGLQLDLRQIPNFLETTLENIFRSFSVVSVSVASLSGSSSTILIVSINSIDCALPIFTLTSGLCYSIGKLQGF